MNVAVVGVDPGSDGAVTVLDMKGRIAFQELLGTCLIEMPKALAHARNYTSVCFLEHVHAMPGQGVSSMFAFGQNFGRVEMALSVLGFNIRLVRSATWTRSVHRTKGATPKQRSLQTAKLIWPEHNFLATVRSRVAHPGLIDSALIAECGRRTLLAELSQGF